MWNGNTVLHAGGHFGLTIEQGLEYGIALVGRDGLVLNEDIGNFGEDLVFILRLKIG